ncbi:MAG: glycosyltransferase [Candidatus Gastranaerophilaceae bacterium]|jgi:uncharacterized protein (TIGR00661 family)
MSIITPLDEFRQKDKIYQKNKIYFSVSSEGLGHSSRILAIANEFDKNEIIIGSYNYAYDRFVEKGFDCARLSQELKLIGHKGAFNVGKTIIKNHSWALKFNKLVNDEIKIIQENGASCVVSDGRLVPVMAADKLSLPCVVITNQSAFYPFFANDSALVRVFGRSFDWIMKTWLSSTEEILIPDFPPPFTVCLPNLTSKFKVMKRTRFVGPLVAWDADDIIPAEKPSADKPYIIVTLGGHAYRKPILDHILETAKLMPEVSIDIFTSFQTNEVPSNVRIMGMVPDVSPYMKAADIVITQAGHSTAMELLTLGKKSIIIPDLKQIEQENNAQRMSELGVCQKVVYNELSAEHLKKCIAKILDDESYQNKAGQFAAFAKEIQGRKKAAEILRDYSLRLQYY